MADGDFEKTVKLTPGASAPGAADLDKTVKLTPQTDKTVKLSPSQSVPEPQLPSIESMLPPPSESASKKINPVRAASALILALAVLACAWYFTPGFLMKKAEELSQEGDR